MKKRLNILFNALSILIFIFTIYVIIGSTLAIKNNDLFRIFGYSYSVVPTGSMEGNNPDSFNKGSAVIVYNTPFSDLEVNDVIVYKSTDNVLIIHRIIEETNNGFIVKGDNNTSIDKELVTSLNYKGKYVKHFNFFNIGIWLGDIRNILLLILLIGLFIAVLYQAIQVFINIKNKELETLKKQLEEDKDDQ